MVNIYIYYPLEEDQEWIHALTIPLEDINRLSLRPPIKWLRFITFAVVGAKGDLSETPDANVVDYEFTDLSDNDDYYFTPEGDYHVVDVNALDDRITSTVTIPRSPDFRRDVSRRDGNHCAITRDRARNCEAAHIIPHSKGDEYIAFVIEDRRHLYEDEQLPGNEIDIDSTENGIFLRKDLHSCFGNGDIGFLKTPNFALDPADIPSSETDPLPDSRRTTMQHLVPPRSLYPVPDSDVLVDWSTPDAPPHILLDYVYGAAVIDQWGTEDIDPLLLKRFQNDFSSLQPLARTPLTPEDEGNESQPQDQSNANSDYEPPRKQGKKAKESRLSKAMDKMFRLSMVLKGYSPQTTLAEIREKQKEAAKTRSRQVMREKVKQWLPTVEASVPTIDKVEPDIES